MTDEFDNAGTTFECTATQTTIKVANARAVIIHPSLGCPVVLEKPTFDIDDLSPCRGFLRARLAPR